MKNEKPAFPQILKRKESLLFLVLFIAGLSLVGWLIGKIIIASVFINYIPIAPSSALIFIILSILFLLNNKFEKSRLTQPVEIIVIAVVILFCLNVLLSHLLNLTWDFENIFVKNPANLESVPIGRMSPITSLLFIFISISICGTGKNRSNKFRYIGGSLSLLACFVSSVLLIGYLYKAPLLYGSQIIPVSLLSAICFLLFSITLLRVFRLKYSTFNLIQKNPTVIKLSKSFIPIVVFIVILQGFLTTNFSINQNNPALTSALILIIVIVITVYTVFRVSAILGDNLMRAEKKLRESEEFSRNLLLTIPFGMDIVDEKGTLLFLSENLKKLFGENAVGNKCWKLYRDDKTQCSDCPLKAGIKVGATEIYESAGVLGGKIFEIVHTGMMFKGKQAILEIFVDITRRKQAEDEILFKNEELQKTNAEKDKFFSIIAHDLKNPFNSIIGFSDLLIEQVREKDLEGIEEYAGFIQQSSKRAMGLLMNLMEWAQSETGRMEFNPGFFNLADIVDDITLLLNDSAKQKTISISNTLLSNIPVYADKAMISTILRNLISNSIKFTLPGGKIILAAAKSEAALTVSVIDNGLGIPKDVLDKLFRIDKNYSTSGTQNEQGTGLGLILCKDFIEKHGGEIRVESELGKGSTFYFTIPYIAGQDEKTTKNNAEVPEGSQINNLKILIAEDDKPSEMLLSIMAKTFSKEVIVSTTGFETVGACRNNPEIDLILMDIQMPDIDGYEITRQIREFNQKVIIIAQTAYANSGDREKALAAGCNDYISKPIKKETLMGLIEKYFKHQQNE
jgi:PAS domain S-box-containing protein